MIPKHKCLVVYGDLYCQPEEGIHCWPARWAVEPTSELIACGFKSADLELIRWMPEDDANLQIVQLGLFTDCRGSKMELPSDKERPYRIPVWGRALK